MDNQSIKTMFATQQIYTFQNQISIEKSIVSQFLKEKDNEEVSKTIKTKEAAVVQDSDELMRLKIEQLEKYRVVLYLI